MTIVTAGAAIVATVALAFWSAAVDTTHCVTIGSSCTCYNDYYESSDVYNGEITELRQLCARYSYRCRFSYVSKNNCTFTGRCIYHSIET